MADERRWNPWSALRARPHLQLVFARLDDCAAYIEEAPDARARLVVLHDALDRRERRVALGHELVHDERDLLYDTTTPDAIVEKEEAIVERILADRLVPPAELERFLRRSTSVGDAVTARDVADEFDVTIELARHALLRRRVRAC